MKCFYQNFASSLKTVSHSVPQESVLGPALFININSMHNSGEYCNVHHYEDEFKYY